MVFQIIKYSKLKYFVESRLVVIHADKNLLSTVTENDPSGGNNANAVKARQSVRLSSSGEKGPPV